MKSSSVIPCLAAASLCGPLMAAQPTPRSAAQPTPRSADSLRAMAFDRLDRTSRMLLSTVDCARNSGRARATGLFGPIDSVGKRGQCLWIAGHSYGVFFTSDSSFTRARQLGVVDLANRLRYLERVDTAAILAEARALNEAILKGFPSFQQAQRQFAPLSFRSGGDSIEVWLVALGSVMGRKAATVGGERGYIYSPDGRTLVREIDAFERFRTIEIPDSGQVRIFSHERDLPLVSELIVANLLFGEGREVQIITDAYTAVLAGREPNAAWIQLRKR